MHDSEMIPFGRQQWQQVNPHCRQKEFVSESTRIRIVEFSPGFSEQDWCEKQHAGYVLSGELCIEFAKKTERLAEGDGLWIPAGFCHRHRARVGRSGAELFLVEDV